MKHFLAPKAHFGFALTVLIVFLISAPLVFAQNRHMKWRVPTGGKVGAPAIGPDGTIYAGSADHRLYALTPGSMEVWTLTAGDSIHKAPAIAPDGTIYVVSLDNNLYAITPEGALKWIFTAGEILSTPAIATDGTIYTATHDTPVLYALNPDGTLKWDIAVAYPLTSLTVGPDGTIYAAESMWTAGKNLYAINPDGTQKWVFTSTSGLGASPAIDADGSIYIGSSTGRLLAISPDGIQKWEFYLGGFACSPAIAGDGTIYAAGCRIYDVSSLYALNPDGTQKWEYQFLTPSWYSVTGTPAISADGTIFIGWNDKKMYALNPDGTKKWQFATGGWAISNPAIGSNGAVYFGSSDEYIYALDGESGALADTPWPKARQNNRHTGRAPGPWLDLRVNGTSEDISVPHTTQLTVTLSLSPGDYQGVPADWWIFVTMNSTHDFWWLWPGNWTYSSTPLRALNLGLLTVNGYTLAQTTLPVGTWDFTFALDQMNNVYEGDFIDSIRVTIY